VTIEVLAQFRRWRVNVSVIVTHRLTKVFPGSIRAVDGIDLEVNAGEIFGFLGPNGAGKTTTIKMLNTLIQPTSGTAVVAGFDVCQNPAKVRKRIGYVAQDVGVDERATGRENLTLYGHFYRLDAKTIKNRVKEISELVDLAGFEDRLVSTYSGGMRKRLDIAMGLIHRPDVIFLDEPTVGLDPQTRVHIWDYIRNLAKAMGVTIFLTTHYMEEADRLADRIAIIDRGNIIATGTPEELKQSISGALQTNRREAEELSVQIFPPEWLQDQVESMLDNLLPWLRSDTDDLDMTIDLRPAKQRARPVVMSFLDQKIHALPDCQPGQVPDLSSLSQGKVPDCIPGGSERNTFEEQFMSQAMTVVDANIELGPDTLDLIDEGRSENETREEFLDDFDLPRQVIRDTIDVPQAAFYGAMAVVLVIIAVLNLPRLKRILRWLGGAMFFAGLPVLVIFVVASSTAPDRVTDTITENVDDVPTAIDTLLSDIVSSGINDLSMSFIIPAAIIMGLGLLCFVLSFVLGSRYDQALSRIMPATRRE